MADILNSKKENGGGGAPAGTLLHRCGVQVVSVFISQSFNFTFT